MIHRLMRNSHRYLKFRSSINSPLNYLTINTLIKKNCAQLNVDKNKQIQSKDIYFGGFQEIFKWKGKRIRVFASNPFLNDARSYILSHSAACNYQLENDLLQIACLDQHLSTFDGNECLVGHIDHPNAPFSLSFDYV